MRVPWASVHILTGSKLQWHPECSHIVSPTVPIAITHLLRLTMRESRSMRWGKHCFMKVYWFDARYTRRHSDAIEGMRLDNRFDKLYGQVLESRVVQGAMS